MSEQDPNTLGPALVVGSLPYRITDQDGLEIARASCVHIAFAMFRSALAEHPSRTLFLGDGLHLMIKRFA